MTQRARLQQHSDLALELGNGAIAIAAERAIKMIMLSTPFGKRGAFFEAWTGSDDWHRVRVTADQCPRISKQFLAEELRELGAMRFSEEYGLEFLDPDEAVFPSAIIDAAFTPEVVPLWT